MRKSNLWKEVVAKITKQHNYVHNTKQYLQLVYISFQVQMICIEYC